MSAIDFRSIGRVPEPGDNVAIAIRRLERDTAFELDGRVHRLSSTVLEGHRFAIAPIARGEPLISWGLPFGYALRDLDVGTYICNAGMLKALSLRDLDASLPAEPNFVDASGRFELDPATFQPGRQVPLLPQPGDFAGYPRAGGRGIGTRNFIVLLGTTSLTGSFVKALAARLKEDAQGVASLDGIVAVAHTEGDAAGRPNNLEFVLRTLAGFLVHPNVGACLAVDTGGGALTNAQLADYMRAHGYPLEAVLHRFYSLAGSHVAALEECARIVRGWIPHVSATRRTSQSLAGLKVALQCGGSDAFSGISANPLAAWVAREVIRHGGSAGLAETDELIGAEPYMLANARDLATAQRFLERIEIFKERVGWHGQSAEGNPTAGNQLRGLYNIAIKSIGAARKKAPDLRLDYVIDYGERMAQPGFYFMDSPGNDLESIAGQVASGCNVIFFTTGSGSITNFPFVPTVKFVTTTGRWNLLSQDMDVNAGRYLDGAPMDELGRETFRYTVDVASGARSVGERAGHSQVSIWRDWSQTDGSRLAALRDLAKPDGEPIGITASPAPATERFRAVAVGNGYAIDQVALVLPTSLCAGQVAQGIAAHLNATLEPGARGISRFIALPHTEGCGASSGENEAHQLRTMAGYLQHPCVKAALLLEHGCERTHNDLMRRSLAAAGVDPARFGYASIQLDGGIAKVTTRVMQWFAQALPRVPSPLRELVGVGELALGITAVGPVPPASAQALAAVAATIVGAGGSVVIPENASLLRTPEFSNALGLTRPLRPSLAYGAALHRPGLHVMATPTEHAVEALSGLGGTGVQVLLAHVSTATLPGHPLIPLLEVATADAAVDADLRIAAGGDHLAAAHDILELLCRTASRDYEPRAQGDGRVDFQLTRGYLGVSL
jgi:altronate dehydratase